MRTLRATARLGFLCAWAWVGTTAGAQNVFPGYPLQREHARSVRWERGERFHASIEGAAAAPRAQAIGLLTGDATGTPGPLELARAVRVLHGAPLSDEEPQRMLEDYAASLDARVVPAFFESTSEGRGAPLAVRVYRLFPARVVGTQATVTLTWIAPDGAEHAARSEPFALRHFDPPGFDMYVRAPLSEPGAWSLRIDLELDGRSAQGVPLPVPCVGPAAAGGVAALAPEGTRPVGFVERALEPVGPRTEVVPGPPEARRLVGCSDEASGPVVIVLTARDEALEGIFFGTVGQRWRALVRTTGLELVTVRAEGVTRDVLWVFLQAQRERHPGRPLVVVARGPLATTLNTLAAGAPTPIEELADGLVLVAAPARVGAGLSRVPTLLAVAEGALREDVPAGVSLVPLAGSAFLAEPDLPAMMAEWLAGLTAPASLGGR